MNTTDTNSLLPTESPVKKQIGLVSTATSHHITAMRRNKLPDTVPTGRTNIKAWFGFGSLILSLAIAGCSKHQPAAQRAPLPTASVSVAKVETGKSIAREEVVGTVRARERATVEPKVSGRIARLNAVLGQAVAAGDVLCELDVREIKARLDQALAQSEQAAKDLERYANLLKQEAVTRAEYDAMEARSRMAAAAVAEAETMLGYAKVTAPFSGVITRKLADVGELASPGRPLVEIENPNDLRVEVDLPESLLKQVRIGAKLQIMQEESPSAVEGTVSEVGPSADPMSRTYRVKIDLPKESGFRPGQFVRVAVPAGESPRLLVPSRAVIERGQLEFVFVVTNNVAQLRLVRTAKRTGDSVEIVSGVSAGETVVTDGANTLTDGQPVQIK
ncbi:MAG TPA: efflux RND transporter periplasmic adaptor subunit [Verrucomicrobiota bacterium]|nr:efflux RND transporter periplasmic adaptor subunit [Verrucomicrobiota bacterium]